MITRKKFLTLSSKFSVSSLLLNRGGFPLSAFALEDLPIGGRYVSTKNSEIEILDAMKDYRIIENHESSDLLIIAYNLTINDSMILPGDRNISIFAYNLSISKSLEVAGKNLYISCNKMNCEGDVSISVSGEDGKDYVQGTKPSIKDCNTNRKSPKAPNADNVSGQGIKLDDTKTHTADSLNGLAAGNIWLNAQVLSGNLSLKADGGNGGNGENGRDGINGCDVAGHYDGNSTGFPGMSGADGALGGYGGDAGNVMLIYKPSASDSSVKVKNKEGSQGKSGQGGKGGHGGHRLIKYDKKTGDPIELDEKRFPPYGSDGVAGVSSGNYGERNGKKGTVFTGSLKTDYFKYIPLEYGKLLMMKAESLYLNGYLKKNLEEATDILEFIIKMADGGAGKGYSDPANGHEAKSYLCSYLKDYVTDRQGWEMLRQKALCYLNQILLGSDIFGNPGNYAPNLKPEYLLNQYSRFIPFITNFENFAVELVKQQKNIELTQDHNLACIRQYENNITQLKADVQHYREIILDLNKELDRRFLNIEVLKADLMKDDENFQEAVKSESGGCGLSELIHVVVAVVEIVAAIYTMGATAALAVKGIADVVDGMKAIQDLDTLRVALSKDGIVRQGVNNLKESMTNIKTSEKALRDAFTAYKDDTKTAPPVLVGVDKDKFDQTINKYLNLPAAQKYKVDFHNFLDYVEQTNQKRLELTSAIYGIYTSYRDMQVMTIQKNELENTALTQLKDKVSISTKNAVVELYYKSKQYLIKMIYLQRYAIRYQNPSEIGPENNYEDYDITTLSTQLFNQNAALIESLNKRNFHHQSNTNPYTILRSINSGIFKAFEESITDEAGAKVYTMEFKISTYLLNSQSDLETKIRINNLNNVFQNAKNIKVMGVLGTLKGKETLGKSINFILRHQGNSVVTTEGNFQGPVRFTHLFKESALSTTIRKNPVLPIFNEDDKTNLVGTAFGDSQNCYLGVSPFASWRLQIKSNQNQDFSEAELEDAIKKITGINLHFWYYFESVA